MFSVKWYCNNKISKENNISTCWAKTVCHCWPRYIDFNEPGHIIVIDAIGRIGFPFEQNGNDASVVVKITNLKYIKFEQFEVSWVTGTLFTDICSLFENREQQSSRCWSNQSLWVLLEVCRKSIFYQLTANTLFVKHNVSVKLFGCY